MVITTKQAQDEIAPGEKTPEKLPTRTRLDLDISQVIEYHNGD